MVPYTTTDVDRYDRGASDAAFLALCELNRTGARVDRQTKSRILKIALALALRGTGRLRSELAAESPALRDVLED
jgi:hypothetical protein